jgi:hypothetical protein
MRVHIEIHGGVATVVYKDKGFEIIISDYDCHDYDNNTPVEESWEADEEVI